MAKAKDKADKAAEKGKPQGDGAGSEAAAQGKLKRAIWHKGKMYDPKKKGDAEAFAKVIAKDKDAAKNLDRLAQKGVVTGFGTSKAMTKEEAELEEEQGDEEPAE